MVGKLCKEYLPLCRTGKKKRERENWLRVRMLGFPGGLDGKESAYNTGDPSLIPGLERSPGEGNGYPLQDSGLENS